MSSSRGLWVSVAFKNYQQREVSSTSSASWNTAWPDASATGFSEHYLETRSGFDW